MLLHHARASKFNFRAFAARAFFCALLLPAFLPPAAGAELSEYKVKAAFIEKISEFVDWPDGAFSGPDAPFVIAIAGADPFGRYLEDLARNGTIKGRAVVLRHLRSGEAPGACHVLYIAGGEYERLPGLLAAAGRAVLTIGDGQKFAAKGTHVGMYLKGGRLRFEINLEASRKSGLKLSSKLLPLAAAVYGGGGL